MLCTWHIGWQARRYIHISSQTILAMGNKAEVGKTVETAERKLNLVK